MLIRFAWRMLTEVDRRLLWKFAYNLGWKGVGAVRRFETRLKRGEFFPAFTFISVTDRCNLTCQGCWVTQAGPSRELDIERLDRIVAAGKQKGSYFVGILGGEPLMHPTLFELFERHPDCYFVLFSNGTLLTDEVAATMRRLGNVSPLISIEGREQTSDERRGGRNVYARSIEGLERCRAHKLVFGVATSVCRSNIDELVTESFVNDMIDAGAHYLWYYIYRPVGPDPQPRLALDAAQIVRLRRFMVDIRPRTPLMVIDAYWDHEGNALCPAAVGISHHIGPGGDLEPCPPIQFANEDAGDAYDLHERFNSSRFLAGFRDMAAKSTRGCILLEDPELLADFVRESGAYDSSGRNAALEELRAMTACGSHHLPGQEIPERSWMYRFAKKHWFFGFGAYG